MKIIVILLSILLLQSCSVNAFNDDCGHLELTDSEYFDVSIQEYVHEPGSPLKAVKLNFPKYYKGKPFASVRLTRESSENEFGFDFPLSMYESEYDFQRNYSMTDDLIIGSYLELVYGEDGGRNCEFKYSVYDLLKD